MNSEGTGTASLTEILWIIICLVMPILPSIIYLKKHQRLRLYALRIQSVPEHIRLQYESRMAGIDTIMQMCVGLILCSLFFVSVGMMAALFPAPVPAQQLTATGIFLLCGLFGGIIIINIFMFRTYQRDNRADRLMDEYLARYGDKELVDE